MRDASFLATERDMLTRYQIKGLWIIRTGSRVTRMDLIFGLWPGVSFVPSRCSISAKKLFNFRRELLPVFDSRREYRPVQPLHEIVSIHQGWRDEVEPGGRGVNVF
jgi:hypothetical protein